MQSPEETFFAERWQLLSCRSIWSRHNRMGQRAFRAHGDSGRERQRRRPVQEPHFLLRLRRRMLLEGGREGHDAHQSHALRSDSGGESGNAGRRMPVLHDDDGRRSQITLAGGKTAHPRFVRVDRRIDHYPNEMKRSYTASDTLGSFSSCAPPSPRLRSAVMD
jgi:hypothetical protein